MPLPEPTVARRRVHTRSIEIEGFLREDGLIELDARLADVKDQDYEIASGLRKAGEPVHDLRLRITVNRRFEIVDALAVSHRVPYPGGCETIAPVYKRLIGLSLVQGFRRSVGDLFGEVRGCSHLTELLQSLPTAAIQTFATFTRDNADSEEKPFQLDRCHALETNSPTVRQYYLRWYRGGRPD